MNGAATFFGGLRLRRRGISTTWLVLAVALVITLVISIEYPIILVNTLVQGGMWALMAAGLALVFGVMNIPNFAHGEFFMIGTLVGIFIEVVLFRRLRRRSREGWVVNTFLLTAGVSVVIVNATQLIFGTRFKGIPGYWEVSGFEVIGVNVTIDRAVAFGLAVVTILAFWQFMRRTDLGRAMRAVAQDETGAQLVGIELNRVHVITLALSSALAALAGAALLFMFPSYPTVGLKPLYVAWYVVILAGLGNVQGAIIGGFLVALLQTMTSYFVGVGWEDVIPTALIIVILLLKPSGLFGSEVKGVWEQ